jgi:putative DNA primase/helicase
MQEQVFDLGEELQKSDLISAVLAIIDLDPLTREQERNRIADEYNVRKSVIDDFIKEHNKQEKTGGTTEIVSEVEPDKNPVNGADLLLMIRGVLQKHVILPGGVAEPIAAWIVLTYCYDAFRFLPMLGIVSPVKRCGKTTLLEVLQAMTNKGLTASNISPAAVYRTVEKYSPTLLVDEADTFLKDNDELRGVLNSGHVRTSAYVIRVQGEDHEPVKFSTWAPKAIAMIGNLPDTLQDRSVVVSLRRKVPGENVSRIDIDFENECNELRRACRRWADDNISILRTMKPDIPTTNNDRVTDNWTPLLAIADVAGRDWPAVMRKSMLGMLDGTDDSIGPELLKDIQDIFQSHPKERIFSDSLVEALKSQQESPWVDWNRGKGLTQNGLARLLKPFSVKSKTMRIGDKQRKGYSVECFEDAFKRYIPLTPSVSSVPPYQGNNINELDSNQSVTSNNDVTDEKQDNQLKLDDWYDGTDEKGGIEDDTKKTDVHLWEKLNFESEEDYLKMIS